MFVFTNISCLFYLLLRVQQVKYSEESSAILPTEFVYHGSKCGCWHSIIRNSLKNLSNTSRMTSGAAYGTGIYLGKAAHTSLSYVTHADRTWAQSGLGE